MLQTVSDHCSVIHKLQVTTHKSLRPRRSYMLARYYTSGSGRFLQVDPGYDYDQLDPMSYNLYGYVRGNPVMGTDPTGEDIRMIYREPIKVFGPIRDAGHIIVQVVDHESAKVRATWSFGPKNNMAALSFQPTPSHQTETKDIPKYLKGKKYQSATLRTDTKTDDKAVQIINDRKKKNEMYDLNDNNCATTGTEVVESATGREISNSPLPVVVFNDFKKATNPPSASAAPKPPKPKQAATTNSTQTTPSQPVTTQDAPSSQTSVPISEDKK